MERSLIPRLKAMFNVELDPISSSGRAEMAMEGDLSLRCLCSIRLWKKSAIIAQGLIAYFILSQALLFLVLRCGGCITEVCTLLVLPVSFHVRCFVVALLHLKCFVYLQCHIAGITAFCGGNHVLLFCWCQETPKDDQNGIRHHAVPALIVLVLDVFPRLILRAEIPAVAREADVGNRGKGMVISELLILLMIFMMKGVLRLIPPTQIIKALCDSWFWLMSIWHWAGRSRPAIGSWDAEEEYRRHIFTSVKGVLNLLHLARLIEYLHCSRRLPSMCLHDLSRVVRDFLITNRSPRSSWPSSSETEVTRKRKDPAVAGEKSGCYCRGCPWWCFRKPAAWTIA